MRWILWPLLTLLSLLCIEQRAGAAEPDSVDAVLTAINGRPDGDHLYRTVEIKLVDRKGRSIVRAAEIWRSKDPSATRSLLVYSAPSNIRGTAFLTHDFVDAIDDQWLYLPAARKVRRISPSARGDQFMGTDFSYNDIKNENTIDDTDYRIELVAQESSTHLVVLDGEPRTQELASELGYGRVRWQVDRATWLPKRIEFWDTSGNPLKRIENEDVRLLGGYLLAHRVIAHNLKTGHTTYLETTSASYDVEISPRKLSPNALRSIR